MTEKPIIFSAPMVQAILAGRKTQTRRILKDQSLFDGKEAIVRRFPHQEFGPRFRVGDRLWVRENWSPEHIYEGTPPRNIPPAETEIWYWADGNPVDGDWTKPKPSIHMPRWASRITLDLNDVRVQRLQDISEDDALAEGMPPTVANSPRIWFMSLWNSINGFGAWDANPWVEALTFPAFPPKAPA